ncbi:hypothetical protein V1477_006034 [Vespula maculifrons]|uniref:Uncharacterized protein n=1 Tax=Vespula maculifrons TaxID=7453 RepID=A0ABD2CKK2_VESMC
MCFLGTWVRGSFNYLGIFIFRKLVSLVALDDRFYAKDYVKKMISYQRVINTVVDKMICMIQYE